MIDSLLQEYDTRHTLILCFITTSATSMSHVNEEFFISKSHVTCDTIRVTHAHVMSCRKALHRIRTSLVTYGALQHTLQHEL